MIDIFARYIDGDFVFEPMKRRGMTKGEYLRAVAACARLNEDGIQNSSSLAAFLPDHITPDQALSLQLPLFAEMNIREPEPIELDSHRDDDRQTTQQGLLYNLIVTGKQSS